MKVGFSRVGDVWTEGRDGWMDASTAQELFEWPRWIGIGGGGGIRRLVGAGGKGREDGKVTAGWMRELDRWMDGGDGRDRQGQVVKLVERHRWAITAK